MRFPSVLLLLASLSVVVVVGCSETVADTSEATESSLTRDQAGIDVQVLQVWTPGRLFPRSPEAWLSPKPSDASIDAGDPTACTTVRTWTSEGTATYENRDVDCTAATGKAAPYDVTGETGPVMTPARFEVTKRVSDGYVFVDPDFCNRLEVRVVIRDAALSQASFAGVGFFTSRGDSFTSKADLQKVGHVRLARGDEATVLRFTGISTCISSAHSSTSGNMYQTFSFKPYAAYEAAGGARYRVWEDIRGNHAVGRSWPGTVPQIDALAFDRQNDLLPR